MPRQRSRRVVELDGRTLEGGGQLVRNALCLSALTGTPISITDIRGRRSGGGGLRAQHLSCVKWLAHTCSADIEGADLKSRTLSFRPDAAKRDVLSPAYSQKHMPGGRTMFVCSMDIGTAGSTILALQAILPYLLFSPPKSSSQDCFIRLHMTGGTNVSHSPSYDYFTQVLLPTLEHIGLPRVTANLERRGWADGWGGLGSFTVNIPIDSGSQLQAFQLAPSQKQVRPAAPRRIVATFIGPRGCHGQLQSILPNALQRQFGEALPALHDDVEIVCEDSKQDKRLYLLLVAVVPTSPGVSISEYLLGNDWLYDRKIRRLERSVTEMVERVVQGLHSEWKTGAWVDEHMRDQLVVFEALANGQSRIWPGLDEQGELRQPSLHAQTAKWVAEVMLKSEDEDVAELSRGLESLDWP